MQSIYVRAKAAGLEIDNHASDLYLKDTPEARRIIKDWEIDTGRDALVKYFHSDVDATHWMEISFAFDPFWIKKTIS